MRYRRARTKGATFFFTVVTHRRRKILCIEDNAMLMKGAFKHVASSHPFKIDAFALLPDHIHSVWTLPENDGDFSMRWLLIKRYFTKRCHGKYKGTRTASMKNKDEQAIWQLRFWEHRIRNDGDFAAHVDYIHYNPVKHGYAKAPKDWAYSTFNRYVKEGIYDINWGNHDIEFEENVGNE
jgi:putative transposase